MGHQMTPALAERVADVARLLEDGDSDATLHRLTALGVRLVPGADAAAMTVAVGDRAHTFAASHPSLDRLHDVQFGSGEGPAVEALRYAESRQVPDLAAEQRWPRFCRAAADEGFASCIVLPLRTDRRPAGVVVLYGRNAEAFGGASHDLALLFAAQGGTAVHNAETYAACRQMVANLHTALEPRAVIEQAKGVLHAKLGISPEEAFGLLSRHSQMINRKLRVIAAGLVSGEIDPGELPLRRR
jgi:ANTAR domain/GAF domain